MTKQRAPIRPSGVPAYFLGRPSSLYLDRYRRTNRRHVEPPAGR